MKTLPYKKINGSKTELLCTLIVILALSTGIFSNIEKVIAQDMNEKTKKIKGSYGEKVKFSKDTWIEFPDFDLIFIGKRIETGGGMHVGITYYGFKIAKDNKDATIYWSSGTGIIGPISFEFNGNDFVIEMRLMTHGREGEDLSFKGKNKLAEDELCISKKKKPK